MVNRIVIMVNRIVKLKFLLEELEKETDTNIQLFEVLEFCFVDVCTTSKPNDSSIL